MAATITVQKGDDATIQLDFTNPNGTLYNATGSTLTFTVLKQAGATPVITKTVTSFTVGGSRATIALTAANLNLAVRAWRYELVLVDGGGSRRSSGLNPFYVTENNGQTSSVSVVVGSNQVNVAVTLTQLVPTPGIPLGGTTGQVLTKASDADNDTVWQDEGSSAVTSVAGRTGDVVLTKTDVGLANVDNTSDANKPISTATQTALNAKSATTYVDSQDSAEAAARASADSALTTAVAGKEPTIASGTTAQYWRGDKSFRTLDQDAVPDGSINKAFTATEKTKLAGVASGANVGVVPNGAITGATKTKITYDAKGLVTAGADATTADIADSTNKRYVSDAQLTVLGNTSGTNTGDQTVPVGGTPALTLGTTNSAGSSPNFLRRDDTILAFDATVPSTQAYSDSASAGVATVAARRDHKHAMPASTKDTTTNTGLLKGNGSTVSAASAGTDYYAPGSTDVAIADGGTGSSTASGARSNLGLAIGTDIQANDADLTTIAGLTATTDNFLQAKASAWSSRTPTQVTADLIPLVGDSGSGGTKGLVPAPAAGDAAASKFLKADGSWAAPSGSGDMVLASAQTVTGAKTFNAGKLLDKGSQIYNVKAYGAVGDGSTDDTSAIQSALTAAAGAGGGIVYLPEATYVVSNITIDSYVELQGAGRGTQLLGKSGSSGYMIALTTPASSQQTAIRTLTLKPNTGTLGGIKLDNTGFGTSIDPLHIVEDVVVLNAGGNSFYFDNSMRELRVTGCYSHYSTGYGFYVGAGCTDGRFIGCTVGPSTTHAYEIIGNNNNFIGCKAFYAGFNGSTWGTTQIGFHLNGTSYSTLTSCSAQQNALHGFSIESCSRCTIVACESDTNSAGTTTGVGINTYWSTYCSISDNTGSNNGILSPGAQKYGLQVDGTQTSTVFFGNNLTGTSGDFGYVSGSGYMLIGPSVADFTGIPVKINDVTQFALAGATSGTTTFTPAAVASGTLTVPSTTDTLVGKATTDTFTNKTYDTAGSGNSFKINGTALTAVTGSGSAVLATSSTLITPNIGVATATTVAFNGAPSAGTASGNIITLTSAQTQAIGDVCTVNSSSQATLAKADAIANASAVLIATAAVSGSASNTYLMTGVLRLSASASWTVGGLIYLSATGTTTNTMTQTAPSGANNVIQPLGIALGVGTILFNPSLTQVEHT